MTGYTISQVEQVIYLQFLSFVDGHAGYTRIFWNPSPVQPGQWALALQYDPPADYDYKWSGN
jgi:hypothetical protein